MHRPVGPALGAVAFAALVSLLALLTVGRSDPVLGLLISGAVLVAIATGRAAVWERQWRRRLADTASDAAAMALLAATARAGAGLPVALRRCAVVASPALARRLESAGVDGRAPAEAAEPLLASGTDARVGAVSRRLAADLLVSDAVGASVAVLADTLAADLREELRLARAVDSGVAGFRATAALLCVLPVAGVAVGRGLFPGTPLTLGVSGGCVAVGLHCYGAGLLWLGWLVRRARVGP